MKRNFLFMLLLTFLPLVGWAQGNIPQDRDLIYTGQEQSLVTQGGSNWVNILYAVTPTSERPVWDENADRPEIISDAIPKATRPGTYYVHWAARQSGPVTPARWNHTGDGYVEEGTNQNVGMFVVTIKVQTIAQPLTDAEMYYGSEIELSPSMFAVTPSEFSTFDLKSAIVENFQINEDLSTLGIGLHPWSIGKKEDTETEKYSNIIELDGVSYLIQPMGGGQIKIKKATNSIIENDGEYAFDLAEGLTFNDEFQNLVVMPQPAEGETEAPKVTQFGNIQFFSMSATAFEELISGEEKDEVGDDEPAEENPYEGVTGPEDFPEYIKNWLEPGRLPQGKDAGTYYVWAKATEGANWEASEPVYVGYVEIGKGRPVLSGEIAGIPDPFYYRAEGWKLTLSGVTASLGNETAEVYYTWQKQLTPAVPATETTDAVDATWSNPVEFSNAADADAVVFELGATYLVRARTHSTDNLVGVSPASASKQFTVVKPTVTIQTLPKSTTMAYGTAEPEFTYELTKWQDKEEAANKYTEPTEVNYVWKKEVFDSADGWEEVNPDDDGHYPVGTYYVFTEAKEGAFTFTDHDAVYEPAKIIVSRYDIVAKFEDQSLVYGDVLPLTLTYLEGYDPTDQEAIDEFNEKPFDKGEFTAKKIKDAEGKDVTNAEPIELTGWTVTGPNNSSVYRTTLLDAGTYEVSFAQAPGNSQIITNKKATWTIAPKDITATSGTPRVIGFDDFDLSIAYTSERIVPNALQLVNKFALGFYGRGYYTVLGVRVPVTVLVDNDKKLKPGEDFEVANPGENKNAGEGNGSFDIVGKGNYTGTQHLTFDIAKAKLPVKPKDGQTWKIGRDENYEVDTDDIKAKLKANFKYDQNLDLTTTKGFKDLYVTRIARTEAGTHPEGLKVVAPVEADNYKFEPQTAALTIEPGEIFLKVKNLEVDYAGNYDFSAADAGLPYSLELADGTTFKGQTSEASKILEENWETLVDGEENVTYALEVPDPKKYNAGNYTITATLPEGKELTSTNYLVTVVKPLTGTLKVNPVELKLTGATLDVDYTELCTNGQLDDTKVARYIENIKTKETAPNDNGIVVRVLNDENVTIVGKQPGDLATDVVERIDVGEFDVLEPVAITPVGKKNPNYVWPYEIVAGYLTVNPITDPLVLTSQMEDIYVTTEFGDVVTDDDLNPIVKTQGDKSRLAANNNAPVQTIKLTLIAPTLTKGDTEDASFAKWEKNQWHALVLPFAVTARDLSYAFGVDGYVIVNRADSKKTIEKDNVMFALPEDIDEVIPANTPFCVKTADAFEYPFTLTFTRNLNKYAPFKIVAPAEDIVKDETFENAWGYTFNGSYMDKEDFVIDYKQSYLRFLGPKKWNYIKNTSTDATYNLPPYNGFVNLGEGNVYNTREVIFTFEEEDGSTTSIRDIDFVNGNKANAEGLYRVDGVKVQGATTQKGVYIQDGKKFVK